MNAWRFQRGVLAFGLALLLSFAAFAGGPYKLYVGPGVPAGDYNRIVDELKAGDVIEFSDGSRVTLGHKYTPGKTTRVFDIAGTNEVIRIPYWTGVFQIFDGYQIRKTPYVDYLKFTYDGAKVLAKYGIPMANLTGYRKEEYVRVERLPVRFTLDEFVKAHPKMDPNDPAVLDLLKFVRDTARFADIVDFHPGQIGYIEGQGWKLFDWSTGVIKPWGLYKDWTIFHGIHEAYYKEDGPDSRALKNWDALESLANDVIRQVRRDPSLRNADVSIAEGRVVLTPPPRMTLGQAIRCLALKLGISYK